MTPDALLTRCTLDRLAGRAKTFIEYHDWKSTVLHLTKEEIRVMYKHVPAKYKYRRRYLHGQEWTFGRDAKQRAARLAVHNLLTAAGIHLVQVGTRTTFDLWSLDAYYQHLAGPT